MRILIIYYIFTQLVFTLNDTLVLINDRVITKNDFIKRSEYTIRPNYCKSSSNIDKKIILNSLIAEKLFAIENSFDNIDDENILNSIDGIKKQAMRKVMLEEYANKHLVIEDHVIAMLYDNSQFEYEANFTILKESQIDKINLDKDFEEIVKEFGLTHSFKYLTFFNCSNNKIFNHFYYNNQIHKGDLIGPIALSENQYILLKILKKKKNIILNTQSQLDQYSKVRDYYIQMESSKLKENFILDLMSGKEIIFDKNTFLNLANYYYDTESNIKVDPESILFVLDDKDWSIEDVIDINNSHPIVLRDSYSNRIEFYKQFKLALVDLIRDSFLTTEAFGSNYNTHPIVVKEIDNWKDYALAMDKKNKILSGNSESQNYHNEYDLIKYTLSEYSESLFNKYSDNIIIDVDMFNEIQLTRIDMMVININQPYQLTVPLFPKLTIKNNLNYGVKKPT